MNKKIIALTAALALLLTGCAGAPKEKTLILSEPVAETAAPDAPAQMSFEVRKINRLSLEKLDPSGIHPSLQEAVAGWIDNDNLIALSVQKAQVGSADGAQTGEVEQPTERLVTQFVRINYQYGFYDTALTLTDVEAECFDVSADGQYVALVAGNALEIYSLHSGSRVQQSVRDVLASRVEFSETGDGLYFTAAGDQKQLERIAVSSGIVDTVRGGKSYRALAAGEKGVLYYTIDQGKQNLGFTDFTQSADDLLTDGRAGSARMLSSGGALAVYGGDLYLISADGAELISRGITAFDLASDGMHIAFAKLNDDGTTDIRIGYWGGARIINDKLTYKDFGVAVGRMFFSPDMHKLYLQGADDGGVLSAFTFEFK